MVSRTVVNFSSYDYLGLNGHQAVAAAARTAILLFGTSVSASRLSGGERQIHRDLDVALARLHGREDALAFVSGHCPCRELRPTILMMKSAEDRPSNELAKPLDRPTARRILVQGQVRSAFVVIAGVGRKRSGANGPRRRQRYDRGTPCGSSRSVSPHARSAKVSRAAVG